MSFARRLVLSAVLAVTCGACGADTTKPGTPPADSPDSGAVSLPSSGCDGASTYPAGTTADQLVVAGATRTFRVHVPPNNDSGSPSPVVLMLHGGGGSGRQFEDASAEMDPIADREGFVTVYPDGTGVIRTWNGGGCCGGAVTNDVDDVGFIAALLDHVESSLCVDERRVFASGMSNGGILSHPLACELSDRIAAIAPVAGTDMTASCNPSRPVPVMHTHGTADGHVPYDGGEGCGMAGVVFTSVPETIARWRTRNGCGESKSVTFEQGDGRCETYSGCRDGADVTLCNIDGGGHNWPGGKPPADLIDCPGNGFQSSTFHASEAVWRFLAAHPRPN